MATQHSPAAPPGPEAEPYPRRWWALAVLCLSLVLIGLDNTILNVALPTMVRELDATSSQLQWIVDSYVLVFAGLLLVAGSVGDRFGRKGALNFGLGVFALGALLSTVAQSAEQLIATRAVMGAGGAFIMPSTLSLLTNIFPAHERPRAIALWAGFAGVGIGLGPLIGGWLIETFWWGSIFLVNLPVVAVAFVAGLVLVPTSRDPAAPRVDVPGALLSVLGLGVLLYAIIEAPVHGWTSGETLTAFAVAAAVLVLFGWWERRTPQPMLELTFFADARFSAAAAAITLVFFAMFGSFFLLTQYLQSVLGYSALEAGVRLMPIAGTIVVAAPLSARLVERVGTKLVVATGLSMVAAALVLLGLTGPEDGYLVLLPKLALMAFGMGTTMAPATEAIMGSLPLAKSGVGSAMNDTTRQVGGALGVAILGSLLASSYASELEGATAALPPEAAAAASDSVGAAVQLGHTVGGPAGEALIEAARTGFVEAMAPGFFLAALVAAAGAVVTLLFLPAHDAAAAAPAVEPSEAREAERTPVEVAG